MINNTKMTNAGMANVSFDTIVVGAVNPKLTTPTSGVSQKRLKYLDSGLAYLGC